MLIVFSTSVCSINPFQGGFCLCHSIGSALFNVFNSLFVPNPVGCTSYLGGQTLFILLSGNTFFFGLLVLFIPHCPSRFCWIYLHISNIKYWGTLSLSPHLLPIYVFLFNLKALQSIYFVVSPKLIYVALIPVLNQRPIYSIFNLTSMLKCLVVISNVTHQKLDFRTSSEMCSSRSLFHLGKCNSTSCFN